MEFSLSPVDSGGDVRMLKQCRPILELGDDRQEHSRSMKLSRTDSFSSARQQESNSSPSPDDHQSSSTLMGTDPHAGGMIYQQQYSSRPLFQQQQGSYSSPYTSIKQSSHFSSSPGFQQQQQQQQQLHYFPFTASQWAELEHQALIFKYMMARAPVPPELVIPIRRSLILTPSPTNSAWSGFQLGVGSGSPMDAEPGRCRRTDGKKWRCSRPVVVDQKYCERHMHRGRNRSRKAAEAAAAAAAVGTTANSTAATAAANTATSAANNGGAKSSAFSSSGNKGGGGMAGMETGLGSYHYPLQTSHGDLASKDQRFVNGMSKAGFDPLRPEQLLFAEVSGSCTRPLGGSSASRLVHHQDIGSMHMFGSSPAQEHGLHMHRHSSSSNSSKPSPLIRGIERKPEALRHFLDDDWPRVDDSTSIAAGFKTVPSSSSTGIFSLALDEEREQERDRGGAEDGHRHHQSDRSSQDEEQEEAYTHMSLATSGGSGDLLSELLLKSPKPPPLGNATKMVLASPTGVLQRLTCFSDSSSSASSPGSVKNDANHAQ